MQAKANTAPRRKRRQHSVVPDVINYIILALLGMVCVYPFYYLFINTISSNLLSDLGEILFWPQGIHFQNYVRIFRLNGLLDATKISLARTLIGTVLSVLVNAFVGFMFTQEKMWMRKLWYRLVIATMYFSAGLIPWYLTMMKLGLLNNFLAYVLPAMVQPFHIILMKTFVESTPKSLQESAAVEGANIVVIFTKIILPICKPILATIAIFCAVDQWNRFSDTLLLMTDQRLYTLQYMLYRYLNEANALARMIQGGGIDGSIASAATNQTATSVRMTVTVIVVLPILFVYPIFQRFFVKGIMIGAVKG